MKTESESLLIEIETQDSTLEFALMGNPPQLMGGVQYVLPDSSVLAWQPGTVGKAYGFPRIIKFLFTYGRDVSAGVVASYLFDMLKGRATKLRIDRTEVQIEEGQITRVITEHIEKSE